MAGRHRNTLSPSRLRYVLARREQGTATADMLQRLARLEGGAQTGTVVLFAGKGGSSRARPWGFIRPDGAGARDCFFHLNDVEPELGRDPGALEGARVEFLIVPKPRGLCAVSVRAIGRSA